MDIEQAIEIIHNGLVSETSVPAQLRANRYLDSKKLEQVRNALDFASDYYKEETLVPKKIALAMVDIYGAFSFKKGFFEDKMLIELEDIGIELQEKAMELFSE